MRLLTLALVLLLAACDAGAGARSGDPVTGDATSAAPGATPAYTDVSRGDTDSIVKLLSFAPGKHRAVIVKPVIYLPNPQFCATYRIPRDDKRCSYAWGAAESGAKITLPRADDAVLMLVKDDPAKCVDDSGAGTCQVSGGAFDDWLGNGEELIRLQTRNGVAVRLAELHLP
ncbi:hypothetical protein [Mangrovihabitans endophyticus]|nr:hypothetical protein [Mangrovihabitans endophyticus]